MKVVYSKDFVKKFKKLPKEIQLKAYEQEKIFLDDSSDPRLKRKKLIVKTGLNVYSFRITKKYRILFYWEEYEKKALFFSIGHRKEVYKKKNLLP